MFWRHKAALVILAPGAFYAFADAVVFEQTVDAIIDVFEMVFHISSLQ